MIAYTEGCDENGIRFAAMSGRSSPVREALFVVMNAVRPADPTRCSQCLENVLRPCRPEESGRCVNRRHQSAA